MTTIAPQTSTSAGTQRLLSSQPHGPVPRLDLEQLLRLAEEAGLTGRGGAGFPTAVKLRAAATASRRPVVVGNAMEGEPLSTKDAVLVTRAPELVLSGLQVIARALRAHHTVLAIGPHIDPGPARAAARKIEVVQLDGGFVAGQETALVAQLNGRAPVPTDPLVRVTERGVKKRPTVVVNAETAAQLGLAARHGAEWFRSVGTPEDPGTSLFSISGAVERPGVVEMPRGATLRDVIRPTRPGDVRAVLVGGYHGAWVPEDQLDVRLTRSELAPFNAAVGAGVLHVLDRETCPLRFTAQVADYLAGESAGRCGPCLNGLPTLAHRMKQLAEGRQIAGLADEILRINRLVTGRGACAHPDGTARLLASTLTVFADHVDAHLAGKCGLPR